MATLPPYPKELGVTEWNKKRGLIAKVVAEPTKLSDLLRKAEAAYHEVPWDNVFKTPGDDATLKEINDQIAKAGTDTKAKTTALKNTITDLRTQAGIVKQTWSANKLVPKDAKAAVDQIIAKSTAFLSALDTELKAGMAGLFVAQQRRDFLNEKESKAEKVNVVQGKNRPNAAPPKMKFTAAAKKIMNPEEESSVVESEESGG